MVKFRSCERLYTEFPVMFAGETYVGEGTVLNVSVPGCTIQSRKRVQPGSYLEMRLLVPDSASPLRIRLAKVRWCEERRFGVEFIQLPSGDQVRLGQFVKHDIPRTRPLRSHASERWRSWKDSFQCVRGQVYDQGSHALHDTDPGRLR